MYSDDEEYIQALDDAEYMEAAAQIAAGEEYDEIRKDWEARRQRRIRLASRPIEGETVNKWEERIRRASEGLPPQPPGHRVFDPSDPRDNTWGNHSPLLINETAHMRKVAKLWAETVGQIYDNFEIFNLQVQKNWSPSNRAYLMSVTWVADVRNGENTRRIRALYNPRLNGARTIIFASGAKNATEIKTTLW